MSRVFVRGPGGWITCPWKYLEKVPVPFGEPAWDHVSGQLALQGQASPSELERAQAVDDLLRRAYHGPPDDPGADAAGTARPRRRPSARDQELSRKDRRVAARTKASPPAASIGSGSAPAGDGAGHRGGGGRPDRAGGDQGEAPIAKVIPMPIFDPFAEAEKRW